MSEPNFAPWEQVQDIDYEKRTPSDWAKIYVVKLREEVPDNKISEYEWAYMLGRVKHFPGAIPDTDKYDKYEEMNFRADRLRLEIFKNAEDYEKEILDEKYVETRWIHGRLRR